MLQLMLLLWLLLLVLQPLPHVALAQDGLPLANEVMPDVPSRR